MAEEWLQRTTNNEQRESSCLQQRVSRTTTIDDGDRSSLHVCVFAELEKLAADKDRYHSMECVDEACVRVRISRVECPLDSY